MREQDLDPFLTMLDDVASLLNHGKTLTSGHKSMFFRALSKHSIDSVRAAFDAHVKDPQRGRFMPVPADILAQIEGLAADDGRPGPEEAWACALRSADENNTVVWTDEMAQAWAVASSVYAEGDEVGARMAFKETYNRLVDAARRARRAPSWAASLGFDVRQRDEVIGAAHIAGRLPAPEFIALPAPEQAFAAIAGNASAPAGIREGLLALRDKLAARNEGPTQAQIDREHTDGLKTESAQRVVEYQGAAA